MQIRSWLKKPQKQVAWTWQAEFALESLTFSVVNRSCRCNFRLLTACSLARQQELILLHVVEIEIHCSATHPFCILQKKTIVSTSCSRCVKATLVMYNKILNNHVCVDVDAFFTRRAGYHTRGNCVKHYIRPTLPWSVTVKPHN